MVMSRNSDKQVNMKFSKVLLLASVLLAFVSCRTDDERAVEALARRVMGDKAKVVVFEQITDMNFFKKVRKSLSVAITPIPWLWA